MAADLAETPVTGLRVQACGDAHIGNFGEFATPERRVVFDINDFDETLPGAWEWDVKRLAASIDLVARDRVPRPGRATRDGVARRARVPRADRAHSPSWRRSTCGTRRSPSTTSSPISRSAIGSGSLVISRASIARPTPGRSQKLTEAGRRPPALRRVDPPLIVRFDDAGFDMDQAQRRSGRLPCVAVGRSTTRRSTGSSCVDVARKAVGVGSVGTLLLGRPVRRPRAPGRRLHRAPDQGGRPVGPRAVHGRLGAAASRPARRHGPAAHPVGQRWLPRLVRRAVHRAATTTSGSSGTRRARAIRSSWTRSGWRAMARSARGRSRGARSHRRSGHDLGSISGSGRAFDDAIAGFAATYADQAERDHACTHGGHRRRPGARPTLEARASTFRTFCYRPARWTVSCSF